MRLWKIILIVLIVIIILCFTFHHHIIDFVNKLIITTKQVKNNDNKTDNNSSSTNETIITITIKIKDNIPIQTKVAVPTAVNFRLNLINNHKTISLLTIINHLAAIFNLEDFDLTNLNLLEQIGDDYTLILAPKTRIIKFYNKYTITLDPLLAIGIKPIDASKILEVFKNYDNYETINRLIKDILQTTKRKYFYIMQKFITF